MKTLTIVALLFTSTTIAHGQDKGFVGLMASPGGAFGLAGAGALSPRWSIGLAIQYSYTVTEESSPFGSNGQGGTITLVERETTQEWSLAPFVRYGIPLSARWSAFGQLQTPVTRGYRTYFKSISGSNDQFGPVETRTTAVGVHVGPGVQFKLAEHWALTADMTLFSYSYEQVDKGSAETEFGYDLGLRSLTFGLNRMF